jgi:hypothetical protein
MPQDRRLLVVPLRSNAHTLLNGGPVAAVRRRLKYASVLFDGILLEAGVLRVFAGPHGSSSFISPPDEDEPPRWQTPGQRAAATRDGFRLVVADEATDGGPGVAIESEATIHWTATLHPFESELPAGCDWIDFVTSRDPTGEDQQTVRCWTQRDGRNEALRRELPVQFARDLVINHANRDLVLAANAGVAASFDPMHFQVVEQRFRDDAGWQFQGFAVPILFPAVGELPWESIQELRKHKEMARFRGVLREVEGEVRDAAASGGDYEAAVHSIYRRHLSSGQVQGVAGFVKTEAIGAVVGGIVGLGTMGLTGPIGSLVGSGIGSAVGTVVNARSFMRKRRARGWVAVDHELAKLTGP